MQRASSETIVLDAEHSSEPAISRPQLSALPAELWRPTASLRHLSRPTVRYAIV